MKTYEGLPFPVLQAEESGWIEKFASTDELSRTSQEDLLPPSNCLHSSWGVDLDRGSRTMGGNRRDGGSAGAGTG